MRITIDTNQKVMTIHEKGCQEELPLYSREGLEALTRIWIKVQWNELQWQSISWHGFPVWQLSDDLLRLQEVILRIRPDVIVETGVNQGGSAVFFASLCRFMGKGRVVSIDLAIPRSVREAVNKSPYGDFIVLIEGDSTAPETVEAVRRLIGDKETTFFFLDSDHSKAHVLRELNAYACMVSPGSYIVAADGIMRMLHDTPNGSHTWREDNPAAAAREFVRMNRDFVIQKPQALFGRDYEIDALTYWPDGWVLRRQPHGADG
jgi:cephalosporin hydroxylase